MKRIRIAFAWIACACMLAQAQTPGTVAAPPPGASAATANGAAAAQPLPPNRWSPAQIREAFQLADVNGDGQLTRAEAQRLRIMPRSFEDSDANKDGVLTLDEYQASFSP